LANRDKAPHAFDDDFEELIARLEERPDLIGRPVKHGEEVRRVYLARIRYHVYFEIIDDGSIVNVSRFGTAAAASTPAPEFAADAS
jgi:hypothetical protein